MRISLAVVTVFALFVVSLEAQVAITGGGCGINGRGATAPAAVGGAPTIGNLAFGISHTPPPSANVSFALFGLCETSPLPDYPILPVPCVTPCGRAVLLNPSPVLMGTLIPPATAVFPLPIPNWPALVGSTFCMQMLTFDAVGCAEISQGISITIQ